MDQTGGTGKHGRLREVAVVGGGRLWRFDCIFLGNSC